MFIGFSSFNVVLKYSWNVLETKLSSFSIKSWSWSLSDEFLWFKGKDNFKFLNSFLEGVFERVANDLLLMALAKNYLD